MVRPPDSVRESLMRISRQYPEVVDWLSSREVEELRSLADASDSTWRRIQGRVNMLSELIALFKAKAP